ncbi:MAG TPA: phage holin family protein [Usitatibacter sp.]|nr:phage holin family protein [Usitatibacter sp.]
MIADLKALASTGLRAVRTRLELLAIELNQEKAWVVRYLIVACAAIYLLSFGTLLAILAFALAVSEENRSAVLGGFGAVFLLAGGGAIVWMAITSKRRQPLFEETVAVLKGDEKALRHSLKGAGDD